MFIGDIAITSLETISCFEIGTGLPLCTLDELQTATIANTEDKQDITGKQGRKLTSLKRNKAVKVTGSNGMVSGGMLELQTGSKFANKATEVQWADYLTVTSNAAATNYTAVGTAGAEISHILVKDKSGVPVKQLTQAAEAAAATFTYDPKTNRLYVAHCYVDSTKISIIDADTLKLVGSIHTDAGVYALDYHAESNTFVGGQGKSGTIFFKYKILYITN